MSPYGPTSITNSPRRLSKSTSLDTSGICCLLWPLIDRFMVPIRSYKPILKSRRSWVGFIRTFRDIRREIRSLCPVSKIWFRTIKRMMWLCRNIVPWAVCLKLILGCIRLSSTWEGLLIPKRLTTWSIFVRWLQQRIWHQCSRDSHTTFTLIENTVDFLQFNNVISIT